MPNAAIILCDDTLNDYLFDQLDLDRRIDVETTLSRDPELAAKVAGYRAQLLAMKKLADLSMREGMAENLSAALAPFLTNRDHIIQSGRFADWLAKDDHRFVRYQPDEMDQPSLTEQQTPDASQPGKNGSL